MVSHCKLDKIEWVKKIFFPENKPTTTRNLGVTAPEAAKPHRNKDPHLPPRTEAEREPQRLLLLLPHSSPHTRSSLLLAPMLPPPSAKPSLLLLSSFHHRHHRLASPAGRAAVAPALLPLLVLIVSLLELPPAAVSDPDDERCLTNLRQSLSDPTHSLRNWSKTTFAAPCNGFTSYLGGATCNNGRVYKLSLANLSLSGTISPFLSNCTNLQSLDLSSNALTGPISPELSSLLNLAVLNLSANRLSGPIPPQLALCAYLNVIDVHANALSGFIPDQLGLLVRLSAFDVSYNQLSGPIPVLLANRSGGLPRFNASSFLGNKDLYGYPLPPATRKGLSVLAIVGIGLGSGLLSLVLSFTAVCIWLRVTEQQGTMPGEEGKISHLMPEY